MFMRRRKSMLRTDHTRHRRAPACRGRGPRQSTIRRKERERRFMLAAPGKCHERQSAQDRAQKALHKHGVLIRLRVMLRDEVSKLDARRAAEVLRREDFIVWRDEGALILTGEPSRSVTFMDIAAEAGILSPDLRVRLSDILQSAKWLRSSNRPDELRSLREVLPLLRAVESPK
jgi:hypothetical protein